MRGKTVSVLVDNDSWILPYAECLVKALLAEGLDAALVRNSDEVSVGWINFMLGCIRLTGQQVLSRNQHNLVVHESDLPKGRGFAPISWQIIEGKRSIPICLLEATAEADAGDIWLRDSFELDGSELCDEWRELQGKKTVEMCLRFVKEYENLTPSKQEGEPSYYVRRKPEDSRLDPEMTISELFDQLRVADNERYPAFFEIAGSVYKVAISKMDK